MLVVNIELLGTLILNEKSALISDVSCRLAIVILAAAMGFSKKRMSRSTVIYRQRSTEFPFDCQY